MTWLFLFFKAELQTAQHDAQHAAQGFGCAPQQLVADGERADVFAAHAQFADASDRDG